MTEHKCEAAIVTCMDYRLQDYINTWIEENNLSGNHDRIAFAGGVQQLDTIMGQLQLSHQLHDIKRAVLINHENCGGYGEAGTPEKHFEDVGQAMVRVEEDLPGVKAEGYYLHLDGTFERVR
jgi:carbonic anhydrase